ncbi:ABC transporter permease [Clostridium intestinale]|uniref:Lipoprotein-releasing system permease protein n=1 Tax=Clostridium intestinale DSM 6191 TaxID=1121320 RepID=A0A1M5XPQ6_9CLOT|nr:ABC transporter permease [Clostridium intestinale]SHI01514.1 lipoprotein-releasing system permease protein [Clostridium intestinale DSM 6191]
MKISFKIALRFLKSTKGQTALIALGIAVGVSVQIFIGSLIQGLQKSLIDKTVGNSSQVTLSSDTSDRLISDYDSIVDNIKESDSRIKDVSVVSDSPALIKTDLKTYSVLVRGMNIDDSDKIYDLKDSIYEGKVPNNKFETLVGKDLKEELNLNLNDKIDLITNSGDVKTLIVTGFYDLKVASINKAWLITDLSSAKELFSTGDKITGIEMQVTDVFKADEIATVIGSNINRSDIKVDNWKDQNASLLSGLNGQSISSYMIQVFVMVSVILGIASVLIITVVQKSKQIGILKAMGIKDSQSSLIFLFEGFLLGLMGAILGVALGLGLSFIFTKFALNPDGTPVVELYINYNFIIISAVIALIASTLAALIPARGSSKLNPIEVIRNA